MSLTLIFTFVTPNGVRRRKLMKQSYGGGVVDWVITMSLNCSHQRACCSFPGDTERSGRLVSTSASYSGGPGFKCWAGDRLPRLRFLLVFLSPSRQMMG
jgi:hypothetical protein